MKTQGSTEVSLSHRACKELRRIFNTNTNGSFKTVVSKMP